MDRVEFRLPDVLPEPISHYTDGVRAGEYLWISGMLPVDAAGDLVCPGDVAGQAEQVFRNIGSVLIAAGATFGDVVKVTVFLIHIDDRPVINVIRQKVFGSSRPASTLVQISALAVRGALLEVESVAVLP